MSLSQSLRRGSFRSAGVWDAQGVKCCSNHSSHQTRGTQASPSAVRFPALKPNFSRSPFASSVSGKNVGSRSIAQNQILLNQQNKGPSNSSHVRPVIRNNVRGRPSSSSKAVPEQHQAKVVAEETTDNIRYRHLIRSKSHIIQGDLGTEYGGTDFGPSPKEMVLSGLAMETSLTMRMFADRKNWPLRRIRVVVKEHGRGKGQLPDGLDVIVHFDGELSREQKAALLEVAGRSPVKNMLLGKMSKGISTRIAIKPKALPVAATPELSNSS